MTPEQMEQAFPNLADSGYSITSERSPRYNCIAWAAGDRSFSPWSMGITFGGGQFFAATILYFTLERHHARA